MVRGGMALPVLKHLAQFGLMLLTLSGISAYKVGQMNFRARTQTLHRFMPRVVVEIGCQSLVLTLLEYFLQRV